MALKIEIQGHYESRFEPAAKLMREQIRRYGGGAAAAVPEAQPRRTGPEPPLEIKRRGDGWMSFKCSCGAVKNLAPNFLAKKTACSKCGREIHIT